MNRIIRLSLFNLKKHRLEAFFLAVLILICTLLLGSSLASSSGINRIFPDLMEKTGCWENMIVMNRQNFSTQLLDVLTEMDSVTGADHISLIYDQTTRYLDQDGREQAVFMSFINEYQETKLEKFLPENCLSAEEAAAPEHPVYMPYAAQDAFHLEPGDAFHLICGSRRFTFTLAGYYESVFFSDTGTGLKMVVSDADFDLLKTVLMNCEMIVYNTDKTVNSDYVMNKFIEKSEKETGISIGMNMIAAETYDTVRLSINASLKMLLYSMTAMAVAIILCVAFMIRFRIKSDIQEQIVSIGVLEALGYQSRQIALSYAFEYCIIAAAGILAGMGCSALLEPALFRMGEIMCGHRGINHNNFGLIAAAGLLIFVLVTAAAYIKAAVIRKYPPVTAFRRGIRDHHFGRERFPLRNTKGSVHIRLAMKHFLHSTGQNIGLTLCILFSVFAITECFILYDYLGKDTNVMNSVAGIELSDLRIEVVESVDTDAFAEELRAMPEIRKLLETSRFTDIVRWTDRDMLLLPSVFRDFSDTENIFPSEGRFPQHDNEVMICAVASAVTKVQVGDTVTLSAGHGDQNYIVSGLVTSLTNGGGNIYLNEDGMKRLNPLYHPCSMEIYLNEGVDADEFRRELTDRYGRSIADLRQEESGSGSDRIRSEAEKLIAEMMAVHGVSHVEYAIQVGDEMMTGNSNDFRIQSFLCINDIIKTQLANTCTAIAASTGAFMFISAVVVMIVLFILMESAVKKQRRDFGIMKSMGYTSRELMFQLACRIMPAALIGVVLGTFLSVKTAALFTSFCGRIPVNTPAVIVLACGILVFCFVCAYVGARKIKKISVCELMTE